MFALSPSFSGDVARPASGIKAVVSPIAWCELVLDERFDA